MSAEATLPVDAENGEALSGGRLRSMHVPVGPVQTSGGAGEPTGIVPVPSDGRACTGTSIAFRIVHLGESLALPTTTSTTKWARLTWWSVKRSTEKRSPRQPRGARRKLTVHNTARRLAGRRLRVSGPCRIWRTESPFSAKTRAIDRQDVFMSSFGTTYRRLIDGRTMAWTRRPVRDSVVSRTTRKPRCS